MQRLGEFLSGEGKDISEFFHIFLSNFDFSELLLDQILRELFKKMQLPPEAQQIDRILLGISEVYFSLIQNGKVKTQKFDKMLLLLTEDSVYQLIYSMMMVQTHWYNPRVEVKISLEKYVASLEFITEYQAFKDSGFLEYLYSSVRNEPLGTIGDYAGKKSSVNLRKIFSRALNELKVISETSADKSVLKIINTNNFVGCYNLIYRNSFSMKFFNMMTIAFQKEKDEEILK